MTQSRSTLRTVLLAALMFFFGLQAFRIFLPKMIWYGGQWLSPEQQALVALVLFATVFLAPVVRKRLGERRMLAITCGGLALVYAGFAVARSAGLYLALATLGIILFGWFIPLWQTTPRSRMDGGTTPPLAAALPTAFLIDTILRMLLWGYDLAWRHTPAAVVANLLIAGAAAALLVLELRARPEDCPPREPGWVGTLPLMAAGPFLYLGMATLHNGAALAAAGGTTDANGYALSGLSAVVGASSCVMAARLRGTDRKRSRHQHGRLLISSRWIPAVAAMLGLVLIVMLALLNSRLGQPWSAAWLVTLVASAAMWGSLGLLLAGVEDRPTRPSMRATTVATFGTLVLMLVVLFLIAQFEMYWMLVVSGVLIALAAVLSVTLGTASNERRPAGSTIPQRTVLTGAAAALVVTFLWWFMAGASFPPQPTTRGAPLRVMTYNIHQGINADLMVDLEAIADAIAAENPDIVALNEVNRARATNGFVDVLPLISRRLGMKYVFGANYADGQYGNAVLSRYPVTDWENTHYNTNTTEVRGALRAALSTPGGPVNVYATHLDHIGGSENARAAQLSELLALWNNQPRSILLGDFNAEPEKPEMAAIFQQPLVDSLAAIGQGDVDTFWGQDGRIDYIFVTQDLPVQKVWVPQTKASDHLPVVGEFGP